MSEGRTYMSAENTIEWLTANEASEHLKIKRRTLLYWVNRGRVKAYALSGTKRRVWRFLRQDLDAAVLQSPVMLNSASPTVLSSPAKAGRTRATSATERRFV